MNPRDRSEQKRNERCIIPRNFSNNFTGKHAYTNSLIFFATLKKSKREKEREGDCERERRLKTLANDAKCRKLPE